MNVSKLSPIGHRVYGFSMSRNLVDCDYPEIQAPVESVVECSDMNQSLFDIVFAVDPRTKLPSGDIAMLMSDQCHPDVRRFIELNLHSPVSLDGDSSGQFSTLSDDDIVEFTRGHNETIASYRDRIFSFLNSQREDLSNKKFE